LGLSCLANGLPMILYSSRLLSFTSFGGVSFDASSTVHHNQIFCQLVYE
jgi:hypothetical protein